MNLLYKHIFSSILRTIQRSSRLNTTIILIGLFNFVYVTNSFCSSQSINYHDKLLTIYTVSDLKFHLYSETFSGYFKDDSLKQKKLHTLLQNSELDKNISNMQDDRLRGGRTARWYYGWEIFKKLPLKKKIFGNGFEYLILYGNQFGETEFDYPHNPFISALLFSGIVGFVIYIWFMILVIMQYLKYLIYHSYFLVCFIAIFFFSFVSANTHFSIPIFAIFCVIPFLTKYIVENEKAHDTD